MQEFDFQKSLGQMKSGQGLVDFQILPEPQLAGLQTVQLVLGLGLAGFQTVQLELYYWFDLRFYRQRTTTQKQKASLVRARGHSLRMKTGVELG